NYHSIKLHSFHVLKNTPMETEFHAGRLHIPTMAEHVAMAADFLENTPKHIAVQRISGDAPKEYIIAPEWCLNKSEIRRELEEEFRRRKSFQGSAL
ncbi:MAG: TIGR01212 family radical SAM protein, partial [Fibrobacteres bacterium]|nr:TIGR01212 family radical SAM protein [Fibrobacterota bacterium]